MKKLYLSNLQSWILVTIYTSEHRRIHRHEILEIYYGCKNRSRTKGHGIGRQYNHDKKITARAYSARVTIVGSLKAMRKKGWISMERQDRSKWLHMESNLLGSFISLTKAGEKKADEILNKKEE